MGNLDQRLSIISLKCIKSHKTWIRGYRHSWFILRRTLESMFYVIHNFVCFTSYQSLISYNCESFCHWCQNTKSCHIYEYARKNFTYKNIWFTHEACYQTYSLDCIEFQLGLSTGIHTLESLNKLQHSPLLISHYSMIIFWISRVWITVDSPNWI